MYVWIYICVYVYVCVCMYVCMYVWSVCMHVFVCMYGNIKVDMMHPNMLFMCVCIYIYIYIYIYIRVYACVIPSSIPCKHECSHTWRQNLPFIMPYHVFMHLKAFTRMNYTYITSHIPDCTHVHDRFTRASAYTHEYRCLCVDIHWWVLMCVQSVGLLTVPVLELVCAFPMRHAIWGVSVCIYACVHMHVSTCVYDICMCAHVYVYMCICK